VSRIAAKSFGRETQRGAAEKRCAPRLIAGSGAMFSIASCASFYDNEVLPQRGAGDARQGKSIPSLFLVLLASLCGHPWFIKQVVVLFQVRSGAIETGEIR
jgi:hypothetical protein